MFMWLLEARGTETTITQWVESCPTVPGGECFPEKEKQEMDGLSQDKESGMLL